MSTVHVAVFAYQRASLLEATLNSLERCDGFRGRFVHIYCDAPRTDNDASNVDATRRVAAEWARRTGARSILRPANLGLHNLVDGISELSSTEGAAASIEEDHVVSPDILLFLGRALQAYSTHEEVFQVCGYIFGAPLRDCPDTFFLPMPMPSGWATWDRAWRYFSWEPAPASLLEIAQRRSEFDFGGDYPATLLLERALRGDFESYFIRWYLAMFLRHGIALCSRRSLIWNTGLSSGLHGPLTAKRDDFFNGAWAPTSAHSNASRWRLPHEVKVNDEMFRRVRQTLRHRHIKRSERVPPA
jgi:hypothetical protein